MDTHKTFSIIVAVDSDLIRIGFYKMIKNNFPGCRIKLVTNGMEAIQVLDSETGFDILITEIYLKALNGLEMTSIVGQKFPSVKVIGFSLYNEEFYILEMAKRGAMGFITSRMNEESIVNIIKNVSDNKNCFPENIPMILIKKNDSSPEHLFSKDLHVQEIIIDIIFLLCKNKENNEIAEMLHLSEKSIEGYRSRLNIFFGTKNISGIIRYGIQVNITEDYFLNKKFAKYFPEFLHSA